MSAEGAATARACFLGGHDRTLLSRVEDAGLNASAPPQQRWMDGWIVRTSPGKAQRARCINAVAPGRRPIADKLAACTELYRALDLPMIVRITPFTEPASLDADLEARGYARHDPTRVMVVADLETLDLTDETTAPAATALKELDAEGYAGVVGAMRGSSAQACRAHAQRLRASPVPYRGFVLVGDRGEALACGQFALEADLVGLYDIATAHAEQRKGLGQWLCKRLLTIAKTDGQARSAYLQVGANNLAARCLYAKLGFADAYSYHYRLQAAPSQAACRRP